MKKYLTALMLALTASSAMAHDEGYNLEIQYNSHQQDSTQINNGQSNTFENNTTDWLFTYYFDEIDTSRGSRSEAAFLNRATSLTVPAGGNESSLGFEYFADDSNFYMRLQNESNRHDQLHLGWMVENNWLVGVNSALDDVGRDWGIYSKRVFTLPNGDSANVKIGFEKERMNWPFNEDTKKYYAEADYYVGQDISVGFTYANTDSDLGSYNVIEYRAQWFMTDAFSLGLSYTDNDDQPDWYSNSNSVRYKADKDLTAEVKWRF
jgi:hypothetical protein